MVITPIFMPCSISAGNAKKPGMLIEQARKFPDLKEHYLKMLEKKKAMNSVMHDPIQVKQLIADLEPIFDDLESELKGKENGRYKAGYTSSKYECLVISTIKRV